MADYDESDARQDRRTPALKGATIRRGDGKPGGNCLIRNISGEGAELEIAGHIRVPPNFTLEVPHEGIAYKAEVRWRDEGRIGVAFTGTDRITQPFLRTVG